MVESAQTVAVIDDDPAVRDSLQWLMESSGLTVSVFDCAQSFMDGYDAGTTGCIVLDVRLPGMSGLDLQEQLNRTGSRVPVIIITGHGDVPVAIRAMKAGAMDFVEKPFSDQFLIERVRAALDSNSKRRDEDGRKSGIQKCFESLSPRERQVMLEVVQGKLNKQIATEMNLSHKTIEVHRSNVMRKMSATCLADLVRMSVELEQVEHE